MKLCFGMTSAIMPILW